MRLVVCMTHYSPWSNQVAQNLQALGHEVHVFDFAPGGENSVVSKTEGYASDQIGNSKRVSGFHLVPPIHRSMIRYVFGAFQLRRLAKRLDVDIVLSLYGGGLALMTYLSGIRPFAVYVVGSDVLFAASLYQRINRKVLSAATLVFANGDFLAQKTREQAPKAVVVPLLFGVNTERLTASDFSATPARMICTREFADVYNNESIIEAIATFPKDAPDFRMVFVSGGVNLQKNKDLADRVLSPLLRAKVEFWGGVGYERLLAALGESSIFLSMSRSDGTATSVLEAMGSGLFPILSDIPQNRALLEPERSHGTLVPLNDRERLASAMLEILRNPERCKLHAVARRDFIRSRANAVTNSSILAHRLEELGTGRHGD